MRPVAGPHGPTTVGELLSRLKLMLGHVRKKDRQTLNDARETILELTSRLYQEEQQVAFLKRVADAAAATGDAAAAAGMAGWKAIGPLQIGSRAGVTAGGELVVSSDDAPQTDVGE